MTTRDRSLTQSINIDAPPHTVWEIITRIDTIVTWYDTWDAVETDSAEPFLRNGTSFRLIRRNHRHPVVADCEVTELSGGRRLRWRQVTPDKPIVVVTFELIADAAEKTTELRQTRSWFGPGS